MIFVPAVRNYAQEERFVDLAVEEGPADAVVRVVKGEHEAEEEGAEDLERGAVDVGAVAAVASLERLLDLVAVAHVVRREGRNVLPAERLLDEEAEELVHLVLHVVNAVVRRLLSYLFPVKRFDYSLDKRLLYAGENDWHEQECEGQIEQERFYHRLRAVYFWIKFTHSFSL